MPEPLQIRGITMEGDVELRLFEQRATVLPTACLRMTGRGGASTLALDEHRARKIFNWLGVWLHKGGDGA